jgi:hypothetical protein
MSFAESIARWETFYFAVGGISATLAGLVFVAMALHAQRLQTEDNVPLREWSSYTLFHFAQVILISIVFLVPQQTSLGLGLPLLAGASYGLLTFVAGLFYVNRHRPPIHLYSWFIYFLLPALPYAITAFVALNILSGDTSQIPLLVISIILLLWLGGHNSWNLVLNRRIPGINAN